MLVRVEWIDAYNDYGRKTEEELSSYKPIQRTSIGYLVCETEQHVILAPEILMIDGTQYFENSMLIPKGFLVGPIRELRVK